MPQAYRTDPPLPLRQDPQGLKRAALRSLIRAAIALALRSLSSSEGGRVVDGILENDRDADLLVKAATSPATLAGTPALQQIALAFAEALVPASASAALIARSLQLEFDHNAEIRVPGLALPHAAFIGEGAAIPVVQGTSTIDAVLDPYKLMTIVHLTGETLRSSNAEAIVRATLLANVGPSLDAAMFNANAGVAGVSPPGLLHGVAGLTPVAGGGIAAMTEDIAALADALAQVAGNGQICLVAAVKQSVALNMLPPNGPPFPVFSSSALTAGTVIAVATQALATAVSVPVIEASQDAVVQEETVPTRDAMTGNPVRSFYQTDSVGLKFKLPVAWALRSLSGIAHVTGTSW
jgi:hypothetical protein